MALLVIMSIRYVCLIIEKTTPKWVIITTCSLEFEVATQNHILEDRISSLYPSLLRGKVISEHINNCRLTLFFVARRRITGKAQKSKMKLLGAVERIAMVWVFTIVELFRFTLGKSCLAPLHSREEQAVMSDEMVTVIFRQSLNKDFYYLFQSHHEPCILVDGGKGEERKTVWYPLVLPLCKILVTGLFLLAVIHWVSVCLGYSTTTILGNEHGPCTEHCCT